MTNPITTSAVGFKVSCKFFSQLFAKFKCMGWWDSKARLSWSCAIIEQMQAKARCQFSLVKSGLRHDTQIHHNMALTMTKFHTHKNTFQAKM